MTTLTPGSRIYLDHSATTPVRPEVLEAMLPYHARHFGNAGSIHAFGREARRAVETAREQVAALINAEPREVFFTSGGTESDNLVLRGVIAAVSGRRRIVISAIEHHAVLHMAASLRDVEDVDVVVAGVDEGGRVRVDEMAALIDERTVLVSVMHSNNETGVLQPVAEVAAVCGERGIPLHSDTVQSVGKVPLDVRALGLSFAAVSGHKLYGPKGIGACYARRSERFAPQSVGGAQERGRRAGTENVPAIVGLGVACELARRELAEAAASMAALRDRLEAGILGSIPGVRIHGSGVRLPGLSNVGFDGVEGESLVLALDMEGIAVSSGSACSAGALEPSHVLLAMGRSHADAQSAVRFSLGRDTREAEIERVLAILPATVERVRAAGGRSHT